MSFVSTKPAEAFFETVWGKTLAVLASLAMLLGVYVEAVSIWGAVSKSKVTYEQARVAEARSRAAAASAGFSAEIEKQKAANAKLREAAEALDAGYKAQIKEQEALAAQIRQKAESDLEVAKAKLTGATARTQERLSRAQTANAEAKAEQARLKAEMNGAFMDQLHHGW